LERKHDSDKSFLRKIAAFSPTKIFRFGYILNRNRNRNRNGAIHRYFNPKLEHILFANLTLALYINGKNGIQFESFKHIPDIQNEKGFKDLKELIDFVNHDAGTRID
jgi:hypothetical protein